MRARRMALIAALTVAIVAASAALAHRDTHPDLAGRVLDVTTMQPIKGAKVSNGATSARTDATGRFAIPGDEPNLLRFAAAGYLPRAAAFQPETVRTITLTPQRGSISLRFGGDAMMGRRFYENTVDSRRWLTVRPRPTVADHMKPLDDVKPLLSDSDLTVVNLETALVQDPYFQEDGQRAARFHPDKALIFATAPEFASAMKRSGIDVVDLANNHVYDALDDGIDSTIAALDRAGLVHFGAGRTVAEAWKPAFATVRGTTVGFVGCTTIDGDDYAIRYVAEQGKPGAAYCDDALLKAAIAKARERAEVVVFMLHGGIEYQRDQHHDVRHFSITAVEAGASVVVNGHPHVVGGVTTHRGVPIVESMGNFQFDQPLWETFASYLFRIDFASGRPIAAYVDPMAIAGYRPVPVVGPLADSSARIAAGWLESPLQLGSGTAQWPKQATSVRKVHGRRLEIKRIPAGSRLIDVDDSGRVGRDLVWGTGSMEDLDTDPQTGRGILWFLGKYGRVTADSACSGETGLTMVRGPLSKKDAIASPLHRVRVTPGSQVTLLADVRMSSGGAEAEIRWYADTEGASFRHDRVKIPPRSGKQRGCSRVRLDVVPPRGTIAAQPYLRLAPPGGRHSSSELRADNVQLIEWAPDLSRVTVADTVEFRRNGTVRVIETR